MLLSIVLLKVGQVAVELIARPLGDADDVGADESFLEHARDLEDHPVHLGKRAGVKKRVSKSYPSGALHTASSTIFLTFLKSVLLGWDMEL